MRKLIISWVAVVALSVAATAQSDYFCYNLEGQPVYLNVFDTLVAVRLVDGSGAGAQTLATNHAVLSDGLDFDFIGNQTFVYRLESGYTLDDAMLWLRLDDNVAMVNPVAHNSAGSLWTMNNRLIATFKETATPVEIAALLDQFGLRIAETIDDSLQVFALERDSATAYDITYYARVLWGSGLCIAAEPDITSEGQAASLDPYYHHQWQLENTGQEGGTADADIDWPESGRYVGPIMTPPIIALLDAGYQMNHEDLPPSSFVFPYDAAGEFVGENIVDFNAINECTGTSDHCWHGTAVLEF